MTTNTSDCGTTQWTFIDSWAFALNGILCLAVILFGLVGNVISIMVLRRDWQRSSMSVLLSALGIYDIAFLILSVYFMVFNQGFVILNPQLKAILEYNDRTYLMTTVWILGHTARFGRNWIAVVVAIDRFVVVNNPLTASQRSSPKRATIYSIIVSVTALLYDLPRIWEIVRDHHYINCTDTWVIRNVMNRNLPSMRILYSGVLHIAFVVIIPIILLTVFNTLLTLSLVRASRLRAQLTPEGVSRVQETRMLVVVIAVFLVTEMPACVYQVVVATFMEAYENNKLLWQVIYHLSNFFTVTNSSANFAIYCMCGRRFRKNMHKMLRRASPCKKPPRIRYETINGKRISLRSPITVYSHTESTRHHRPRHSSRTTETAM